MNRVLVALPTPKGGPYPDDAPDTRPEPCPPFDRGRCIECLRPIPFGKFCQRCGYDEA